MDSIFHRVSIRKFQDKPVEPRKSRNCFAPLWRLLLPETSSRGNFMW